MRKGASNNIIQNNHLHENGNNAVTLSIDIMNNQVINNAMENGNYHGVEISDNSNNNIVSGNTISGNVQGILLYSYCHDNLVTGNTISNNEGTGLNYGIKICRCSSNTVSANSLVNNAFAGVWIDGYDTESNIVSDNLIRYNGVYGVLVQFEANGNTVSDNAIENSGLAGILLELRHAAASEPRHARPRWSGYHRRAYFHQTTTGHSFFSRDRAPAHSSTYK